MAPTYYNTMDTTNNKHVLLVLLLLSQLFGLYTHAAESIPTSITVKQIGFHLNSISETAVIASGHYSDNVEKNGWNVLEMTTSNSVPDLLQAYALGFLEGTYILIYCTQFCLKPATLFTIVRHKPTMFYFQNFTASCHLL